MAGISAVENLGQLDPCKEKSFNDCLGVILSHGFNARVDVRGMRFMSIGIKDQVMIKEL